MLRRCGGRMVRELVSGSSGMSSNPAGEILLWSFAASKALNYCNALSLGLVLSAGKFTTGINPKIDQYPIQSGVQILLVTSCYRNPDKLCLYRYWVNAYWWLIYMTKSSFISFCITLQKLNAEWKPFIYFFKWIHDSPEHPNSCSRTQVSEYGNLSVGIRIYLADTGLLAYEILRDGVFLLNCKEDSRETDSIRLLQLTWLW